MRNTSSTMSRRLLISRSRPDVSTVAGAAGTGVGAGASVAATLGTLCWLLIRARVGPGEIVHASCGVLSGPYPVEVLEPFPPSDYVADAAREELLSAGEMIETLAIDLEKPEEQIGAKLLLQACSQTDSRAGDGTTTSTILTQALVTEGLKLVASGANPIALQRGLQKASKLLGTNISLPLSSPHKTLVVPSHRRAHNPRHASSTGCTSRTCRGATKPRRPFPRRRRTSPCLKS